MKNALLISFFFVISLTFSQTEREVINHIDSINSVALYHYKNNDIVKSFNFFTESVKLSDSLKDNYGNAVANFTLGKIYNYMKEYNESENCYTKMLKNSIKVDDNYLIANSYLSLGETYLYNKSLDEAIPYFKKALEFAQKNEVRDQNNIDQQQSVLFNIRTNLSKVYLEKDLPNVALKYVLRAENNIDNSLSTNYYSKAYLNYLKGLYFIEKQSYNLANNKFKDAIRFLEKENSEASIAKRDLLFSKLYKELSLSYVELDKNNDAYSALIKHNNFRERFINEEKIRQEKIIESKLFLSEYKHTAQSAINDKLAQQQISNRVRTINIITIIAIAILIISFLIIYKNYKSKQRLTNILKARNEQLEFSKAQAEKSSRLKTKFISNVTHELRTPLYGVVGLTSLLLNNNDLSEKDSKYLKSLKFSGDYLLNLVNDILQIGKMESHKVELKSVTVNLKTLVENIISSFENRLQESNNQIQIVIDDSIPKFVKCDSVRLSQILINLLGNSIKFTQNGKIWLRVKLTNINQNEVSIRFEVEDNGPGIDKSQHNWVFENFSQLNANTNVDYQGTGLGLSIVKNLVELFKGRIELESELGKGSTFSFNATFDIDHDKIQELKEKKNKILDLDSGYKILVAEDNKINQIVTQSLLSKVNYECQIVQNGVEVLKALKENSFDLILMDINMPIMNGNEATKEIRKFNSKIPIIALTAADIEEVKKDYKSIGFNDIITKPFDNYEFYQIINTNIQQSKLVKVS